MKEFEEFSKLFDPFIKMLGWLPMAMLRMVGQMLMVLALVFALLAVMIAFGPIGIIILLIIMLRF